MNFSYILLELPFLLVATVFGFLTARALNKSVLGKGMRFVALGSLVMALGHLIMITDGVLGKSSLLQVFGNTAGAVWLLALSSSWLFYGLGFYRIYATLPKSQKALHQAITEQQEAVDALQASEARYRDLILNARDVIYTLSTDGIIMSVNPAFEATTGWQRSEWLGKSFVPLVYAEDVSLTLDMFQRTVAGDNTPPFTARIIDKAGGVRVGEFYQTAFKENGITKGVFGVGRDVTDRVKAEEQLRNAHDQLELRVQERTMALSRANDELQARTAALELSQERLHQSLSTLNKTLEELQYQKNLLESESEASIDGILVLSKEDDILSMNQRFIEMWSVPNDFKVISYSDLHETLEAQVGEGICLMDAPSPIANGRSVEEHDEIKLRDGRIFEQRSAPVKDKAGQVHGRIWYFRDITVRRQAEEALRETEQRFRAVSESASDAIITANCREEILSWNLGAQIMFGYRSDEIVGRPLRCLIPQRYQEKYLEGLARVALTGESSLAGRTLELYGVRKDRTEFPLELSLAIWKGTQDTFFSGIVRDLTERLRAEAARARLVGFLLGEFERRHIARELHDQIGQALTGLKLTIEMAERLTPQGEAKPILVDAELLVEDLIKRVQALSLDLRPPMLDDLGLLAALLWHVQQFSARSVIEVEFDHAGLERRRFGHAVETAAYRVVQESLTNIARHAGVSQVRVRVFANETSLNAHIEDQGRGFDVQEAQSRATSGLTGMRERAAALGGELTIESKLNGGTRVMLEIPFKVENPSPFFNEP